MSIFEMMMEDNSNIKQLENDYDLLRFLLLTPKALKKFKYLSIELCQRLEKQHIDLLKRMSEKGIL